MNRNRILSVLLALCMTLSLLVSPAFAADKTAVDAAQQLHTLGLMSGTGEGGYALDRSLTRQEAAALLVRLMGKEDEAKSGSWYLPTDDVDGWAKPFVGYACAKGVLDETMLARFGGRTQVSGNEYREALLRALGYAEDARYERTGIPASSDAALSRGKAAEMTLAAAGMTGLSLWTEGVGKPRRVLEAYMEAITDPTSVDYIPVENRIAVFDLDGTLFCETDPGYMDHMIFFHRVFEDPTYTPTAEQLAVGELVREYFNTGDYPSGLDEKHAKANAEVFAGMTPAEYDAYAKAYAAEKANGYEGMARGEAFYEPMLQLIRWLQSNEFTVYIVSGTNRPEVRALVDGVIDIPNAQIIGTDETIVASGQDGKDGLSYQYTGSDKLVMGGDFLAKNLKMNKVSVIAREIGQQPVLSFGNSSGDSSMANYVVKNNPYRSAAFMLCCDDLVRENGNMKKADSMRESCEKNGWVAVSMRDDWSTIYGVGVTRNTK